MSTRSRIAKINPDGSITSIYCHSDGYLEGVGKGLLENYRDESKIDALMALGALSVLGSLIGEKHDSSWVSAAHESLRHLSVEERWDQISADPRASYCRAYHRDRGDQLSIQTHADHHAFREFLADDDSEFAYLWNGDGWLATSTRDVNFVFIEKLLAAATSEEETPCTA